MCKIYTGYSLKSIVNAINEFGISQEQIVGIYNKDEQWFVVYFEND